MSSYKYDNPADYEDSLYREPLPSSRVAMTIGVNPPWKFYRVPIKDEVYRCDCCGERKSIYHKWILIQTIFDDRIQFCNNNCRSLYVKDNDMYRCCECGKWSANKLTCFGINRKRVCVKCDSEDRFFGVWKMKCSWCYRWFEIRVKRTPALYWLREDRSDEHKCDYCWGAIALYHKRRKK